MNIDQGVAMNQSVRFWNRVAERYSRRPIADEAVYRRKLEITREHLRPDMQVLELGCGTGSTALLHAPYVRHIRALDISSKMIEIARRKAEKEGVANVSFECSAIDDFELDEGSIEAVLALSVLHLLEDRDVALARVHRALKPGGVFVTSTACLGDSGLKYLGLIAPVGRLLGLLPLVKVFTVAELVASLTDAGFEIEHQWEPGKGKAVFIVARKPAAA